MNIRTRALAIASLVVACVPAFAYSPGSTSPDAHFMQGSWCMGDGRDRIEETWLTPRDGESLGMSRTTRQGKVVGFEFMRIARVDGKLHFLAQPGGKPPTLFPLIDSGMDRLAFENPAHDFPQRIEYSLQAGGPLVAVISGPGKGGKRHEIVYRYRRCEDAPPGPIAPIRRD